MKHLKLKRIGILLLFLLSSITGINAMEGCNSSFEGVWRTEGYGLVIEVTKGKMAVYETTAISGIKMDEGTCFGNNVKLSSGLELKLDMDSGKMVIFCPKYGFTYEARRLMTLPASCKNGGMQPSPDPELNFNVFYQTMKEQYAFFQLRRINWEAQYRIYRSQVTKHTTPQQLFEIMHQMVKPLQDGHVRITGPEGRTGYGVADDEPYELVFGTAPDFIRSQAGVVAAGVNHTLTYRHLTENIGLITPLEMDEYGDTEAETAKEIDGVIEALADKKVMIIDLRFNPGGGDRVSRMLAGRFADRKRLAYRKQARDGAGYTPLRDFYVEPQGSRQFHGKVIVLTSRFTCSAAEILVMGLKTLPNVTVIGERTNGIHSDVLGKLLPNGWSMGLSNERYYAADNRVYEKIGLQPDIQVEFDFNEFMGGKDRIMDEALLYAEK